MMRYRVLPLILAALAVALPARLASAQATIFFVRHAERADSGKAQKETDPDLSDAGRTRAQALAAVLKDAKITAIFTTEFKRTQQTASPLAKALGLTISPISSKDTAQLVKRLTALGGNALVVGHSDTVPGIIKAIGAPPPPDIRDDEFDNLYVVTRAAAPVTLRLHYR